MNVNLEELKKNHETIYFAEEYERLLDEEKKVKNMLKEDKSLKNLVEEELRNITFQKEGIEKQLEEIKKDRKSTRLNSSHTDISRMPSSA